MLLRADKVIDAVGRREAPSPKLTDLSFEQEPWPTIPGLVGTMRDHRQRQSSLASRRRSQRLILFRDGRVNPSALNGASAAL